MSDAGPLRETQPTQRRKERKGFKEWVHCQLAVVRGPSLAVLYIGDFSLTPEDQAAAGSNSEDSMATPCSLKALGLYRPPPHAEDLDVTDCDLKVASF